MSKAEKRACQYTGYCRNQSYKDYLNGYHQAEEDLTEREREWLESWVFAMYNNGLFKKRRKERKEK